MRRAASLLAGSLWTSRRYRYPNRTSCCSMCSPTRIVDQTLFAHSGQMRKRFCRRESHAFRQLAESRNYNTHRSSCGELPRNQQRLNLPQQQVSGESRANRNRAAPFPELTFESVTISCFAPREPALRHGVPFRVAITSCH